MRKLLLLSLVVCGISCAAQPAILKVLGKHEYSVEAQGYGVIFVLEENTDKCDPVLGFISLEEQLKHLSEAFAVAGFEGPITPVTDYSPSPYRKKTYRVEVKDQVVFEAVLSELNIKQAIVKKTYYDLPPHRFVDEDESAVAALIDAKEKAAVLVQHLGYKITRLLNVDDDTSGASYLFDTYGDRFSPEQMRQIAEFAQKLTANTAVDAESKSPSRNGSYNIWVTFEIAPAE